MVSKKKIIAINLQKHFKNLGIAAFTNCCRIGCTGTYEENESFEYRENGIIFVRLHLNGMNFTSNPSSCFAYYQNYDYLNQNWEEELEHLKTWCNIIGLEEKDYSIIKPENETKAIKIEFFKNLHL